ncbi:hypothetical protein pdam_00023094 [Pocillopora damicornis]|uniref:Tafazzin n=1 Tax=Pocillopora damicornis TaxID=46731 RepID=A0A3M6TR09_POCDA|nr:hypothetical protein pdam_00023094 [Pocillopora damicornis]
MAAESIGGLLYGYKNSAIIQPERNDVVWVNKRHDPLDLRSNAPVQRSKFICGPPDMAVDNHWKRETQPSLKTFSRHLEEGKWYPSTQATRCEEWSTLRQMFPSKGVPDRVISPRWGTGLPLAPRFHPKNQQRFPHINSPMTRQLPKKEKYYAIKEDIPHIKCETCQKAVKYLYGKTHDMRTAEGTSKPKRLEEDKVIELVEKSCNPEKEEGSWISKIDLVEKDGELRLSEQTDVGKCKRECQTVSKACEESVGDVDTDLAELLWKDKLTLSRLINEVCYSMSNVCKGKKPKLKAGERKVDEEFHVMTEDEKKADEVLKQMSRRKIVIMKSALKWPLQMAVMDKLSWRLQSTFLIGLIGLSSKIFLEWFNSVRKYNFDVLERNAKDRPDGVPLVTVCNHTSCLDDPCLWGLLQLKSVLNPSKQIRWTLGAQELLFSTPFRTFLFSRAKAIPVIRGDGIFQKGVDVAIEQLNKGEWIHVFPEGAVNINDSIKRLKWGVGRLIAEAQVTPIVVPFWHEDTNKNLVTVLIGEPMEFTETVEEYRKAKKTAMETRKHITDKIQERFKELKEETRLLHSKWR